MIKFGVEKYHQVCEDIKELIKLHYEEIAVNKDVIPLDPDWDRYKYLDDNGLIMIITARDESKLVGYSIFFITSHLHYKSTVYANNDLLYLHPEYRKGSLGIKLISYIPCSTVTFEVSVNLPSSVVAVIVELPTSTPNILPLFTVTLSALPPDTASITD